LETITPPVGAGHEGCNQTIQDLLKVIESQRTLLEAQTATLKAANQTIATLNSLLALTPPSKSAKRGKGRPTKHTDDSLLLEIFNSTMLPEFRAANRNVKPTDSAVLTWYFTKEFSRYGWSASRVRGKVFQGKLKTLKNRISDARNPIVKLPIK
jgi:phage terminase small subunit